MYHPLKNWIPYKLDNQATGLSCRWLNTFEEPFAEPFFDETIRKCIQLKDRAKTVGSVSDLSMIEEWSRWLEAVAPTAFIFHLSRCGSTLVSQQLAIPDGHIVLSEVPFFDDLLRLPLQDGHYTKRQVSNLLAAAIKYYSQKRTGKEEQLFIKTDCWHILFYEQLRALYPLVPFILLYRSPDEVFNSHKKLPGMQSVPGLIEPEIYGFDPQEIVYHDLDKYFSAVLEKLLTRFNKVAQIDNNALLINYNEGPMPIISKIARFTNLRINDLCLEKMELRARHHSKNQDEFIADIKVPFNTKVLTNAIESYNKLEVTKSLLSARKEDKF